MKKIKFHTENCTGCKTCEIACTVSHSNSEKIEDAILETPKPTKRVNVTLKKGKVKILRCVNCKKPKCVEVCESDAIHKEEDGRVVFIHDNCTGCWECIEACPFDAISKDEELNIAVKCDLCGNADTLACVDACPTEALIMEVY